MFVDDSLPLNLGFPEGAEQTQHSARGSQVIETLRGVFFGEALDRFQLEDRHIFREMIGKVLSNAMALASYRK